MSRFKDLKYRFHDDFDHNDHDDGHEHNRSRDRRKGIGRKRNRKFKFNRDENEDILNKPILDSTDINKNHKNQEYSKILSKFDDSDFGISRNSNNNLREINTKEDILAAGFKILSLNTKDSSLLNIDDFKYPDNTTSFIGDEFLASSGEGLNNLNNGLPIGGVLDNLITGLFGGNNSGQSPTIINGVTPNAGPVGTTTTLVVSGSHNNASVEFNGITASNVQATPVGGGNTLITATVPNGASTGNVTVEIIGNTMNAGVFDI